MVMFNSYVSLPEGIQTCPSDFPMIQFMENRRVSHHGFPMFSRYSMEEISASNTGVSPWSIPIPASPKDWSFKKFFRTALPVSSLAAPSKMPKIAEASAIFRGQKKAGNAFRNHQKKKVIEIYRILLRWW